MTKYLLIIASLLLFSIDNGQAQTNSFKQELSLGVSFGMNFSSVSFSPKVNQKMKQGYQGGVTLRWITENHLGLQAELNYAQQGWEEEFEEQPEYQYSRTINYIELPFLTHIYFGGKRFKFFFNLGPKIGYALSERPIEKKFDWGLCGGPGLELSTGIGHFLLEGRYYYALGDIYGSQKKDPFARSASQTIGVKFTYLFPLWR